MCGIVAALDFSGRPVPPGLMERMSRAQGHRGPDGEGALCDGAAGLGHVRLAVIDVSDAGSQPMRTEDGRWAISYNGELYNFRELRAELEGLGWRFTSRSDTEVVLKAYVQWGAGCLDRFNGMFAFAVWDARDGELFVARDRYGVKPLYWARLGRAVYFASEHKAFLEVEGFSPEVDTEGLLEYFTFQNFFTDRTLLSGVRLFPAGCWALLRQNEDADPRPVRFWDYAFEEPENPRSEKDYLEELDHLTRQAIKRQLVSDVPLGAYLSGGMDSGTITAVAAGELPYIKSFTCGMDLHSASGLELAFDERKRAEFMSYKFRTEHYEMVIKAGDMERVMPELAWHLEEPRTGQCYPNFYAAKLAAGFVKVVLAGTGGDELFGGYPWRYYRAVVNRDFDDYLDKYYLFWQRLIPNSLIREVFAPVWDSAGHVWTRDIFAGVFPKDMALPKRPEDYVHASMYFEAKTFLHGLLVVEDKLSMAHGIEMRVPFLDNDLVDFAMKLPARMKLGNLERVVRLNENEPGPKSEKFFNKTSDGKLLLRRLMRGHLPDEVSGGAKQGFSAPDSSWFKGESMDYVRDVVFSDSSRIFDFLAPGPVRRLVGEHFEGKVNRRLFIWSLLVFESWCRNYLR